MVTLNVFFFDFLVHGMISTLEVFFKFEHEFLDDPLFGLTCLKY